MTREELKAILKAEHEDESCSPRGASISECAEAMLEYLGDTDPVLRDEYIYEAFFRWIDKGLFTEDELRRFLLIALDGEHLLWGLGREGDESVFMRTFSALLIATILQKDIDTPFLSAADIDGVRRSFLAYYRAERDMRGYVRNFGWAHSAAHGADVLEAIAASPKCTLEGLLDILFALRDKLSVKSPVYIDGEPSRFAAVVLAPLKTGLLREARLEEWLGSIEVDKDLRGIDSWHSQINIQNFFMALYFKLKKEGLAPSALDWLERNIKA